MAAGPLRQPLVGWAGLVYLWDHVRHFVGCNQCHWAAMHSYVVQMLRCVYWAGEPGLVPVMGYNG